MRVSSPGQPLDQVAQRLRQHRFRQEVPCSELAGGVVQHVRVVGGHDDRQGRRSVAAAGLQRCQHACPVQAWHHPVDQQQVVRPPAARPAPARPCQTPCRHRPPDRCRPGAGCRRPVHPTDRSAPDRASGWSSTTSTRMASARGSGAAGGAGGLVNGKCAVKLKLEPCDWLALDPDPAAHQFDDLLGNRQAQTRAAIPARGRAVGLGELLEQPVDLLLASCRCRCRAP